ncbi:Lrp/AsnC family transcriptional regulator [Microterricola pindariensis]|uniref:AsnC family transcriptional regulator n=1 Tax=Microterricola pindariensis TaxID=478010 RepID=A0ABX5AUV8_9MICO|nr:Lrp/AsnC family transcriptional regulator [Microterricola pindariensis]PPL17075.1 AsnC family transcriptional regulator [Microterricola pindariensis]
MNTVDGTDKQLLQALSAEPRSTFVALADRLGVSRNTVQARMNRLEHSRVFLPFERCINPAALGYPLTAFIEVNLQQRQIGAIIAQLARIPQVLEAHGMSGQADLLVRVVCSDAEDLFHIDATILAIDGVERTATSLSMSELIPYRVLPLIEGDGGATL